MKNKILQRSAYGTKLRFPGYNKAWKTAQLGDVCKIVSERLDPKNDSSVRCIELEHIEACTGRLLGTTTTAEIVSLKAVFRPGDVLFGKLRPYLKKFYMPSFTGVCSTEIWVLRPTNCVIDAAFLFCIIQSSLVQRSANATFGTKMPRADWDVVSATPIRFPELDEQSRISGLHQSINQTTEYLDRLIAAKREQKRGLMQQLLTGKLRFPGFTESWKTVRLEEVVSLRNSKAVASEAPDLHCIELEHIEQGTGELIGRARAGSTVSLKTEFAPGDVLFGKLRPYLKKFALVDFAGYCSTEIWAITANRIAITSAYLRLLVESPAIQRAANATSGTKMPRADWDVVAATAVKLPSIVEQERITALTSTIEAELRLLNAQRAAFAAQRRGLMEKLLSGEIDIQNPKETAA